jgi:hypothetical protein
MKKIGTCEYDKSYLSLVRHLLLVTNLSTLRTLRRSNEEKITFSLTWPFPPGKGISPKSDRRVSQSVTKACFSPRQGDSADHVREKVFIVLPLRTLRKAFFDALKETALKQTAVSWKPEVHRVFPEI